MISQYNWENDTLTVGDQTWRLISLSNFRFNIVENGELNPIKFDIIQELEEYITPDVFEAYKKFGQAPFKKIKNKYFAFTGRMTTPRANLEAIVLKNGGYVHQSVNSKTDFLVSNSNKTKKARKAFEKGTYILTEDEFLRMV